MKSYTEITIKNTNRKNMPIIEFLESYGYVTSDMEENFKYEKSNFSAAVFLENKTHILKNCMIVVVNQESEESIKNIFGIVPNLKYVLVNTEDESRVFSNTNKGILEIFELPSKNKKSGLPKKIELKEVSDLTRVFNIIHNHIYANEGLSPTETFLEILKLLFLKIQDENSKDEIYVKFGITDEEYYNAIDGKPTSFLDRINQLLKEAKKNFSDVFSASDSISLNESTLAFVVNQLQYFNLSKSKRDVKGAAFQKFIYSQQRGSRGQFLTPEPIIKFMVEMMEPSLSTKILDPSCGSGGFLIESLNFVTNNELRNSNSPEKTKVRQKFSLDNLAGIEINPTMAKVVKMRMILENIPHDNISKNDALSDWDSLKTESRILKENYDLILTNPPFGTQGKITNKSILSRFDLSHTWKYHDGIYSKTNSLQNGQVPDILFLERCLDLLKEGGKLAIVVPTGDLENKTLGYLRQYILNQAKIIAVVSLPQSTFIPFGTGVKTAILFLQKLNKSDLQKQVKKNYEIFFSVIENIGYEGNKNGRIVYKKNKNGKIQLDKFNESVIDEDISYVIDCFKKFLNNKKFDDDDKSFIRNYSDLINRFDPEFYRPVFKNLDKILKTSQAVPLKDVVKIIKTKPKISQEKTDLVRYVEIGNINPTLCELNSYSLLLPHELPSRASYEIKSGDVITAVAGISTGTKMHATAFVSEEFDGCICTNGLRVLRPTKIDAFYLLAYLRSDYFLHQMLRYRTGATIPAVADSDLEQIKIIMPNYDEQKSISKIIQKIYDLKNQSRKLFEESKLMIDKLHTSKNINY